MQRNRALEVKKKRKKEILVTLWAYLTFLFKGKKKLFSWQWILDCKALSTETKSKTKGDKYQENQTWAVVITLQRRFKMKAGDLTFRLTGHILKDLVIYTAV